MNIKYIRVQRSTHMTDNIHSIYHTHTPIARTANGPSKRSIVMNTFHIVLLSRVIRLTHITYFHIYFNMLYMQKMVSDL